VIMDYADGLNRKFAARFGEDSGAVRHGI